MATSRRTYAKRHFPGLLPVPSSLQKPLLTHISTGDSPTLAGRSDSVSCGVSAPFPWVLVYGRFCLCLPRVKSLFPSVLWKSYNQVLLPSKSGSVGIPSPFARSPSWEAWREAQNHHNREEGELLWYYCSPDCGWPSWQVEDFIMFAPLLLSQCGFLSLDMGYLFLGHEVPSSSCQWLFNTSLRFWCSCRKRWVHVLLLHHLELETLHCVFIVP